MRRWTAEGVGRSVPASRQHEKEARPERKEDDERDKVPHGEEAEAAGTDDKRRVDEGPKGEEEDGEAVDEQHVGANVPCDRRRRDAHLLRSEEWQPSLTPHAQDKVDDRERQKGADGRKGDWPRPFDVIAAEVPDPVKGFGEE